MSNHTSKRESVNEDACEWWEAHVRGRVYVPLRSLAEAQSYSDSAVTLEGDSGGTQLASCPVRFIRCTHDTLNTLLVDLDALVIGLPNCCRVRYGRWAPCEGALGREPTKLSVHWLFDSFRLDEDIRAVLSGEIPRLPRTTEELLQSAKAERPDDQRFPKRLANYYKAQAIAADGQERKKWASKASAEFEIAFRLDRLWEKSLLFFAMEMALEAGEMVRAKGYANWLLRWGWNSVANARLAWDAGQCIHRGNIVLGKIALHCGDVETAKLHLTEAGRAPWAVSKYQRPDMTLARNLVELGQRATVIEYLRLCKSIWEDNGNAIPEWIRSLEEGGSIGPLPKL